MTDVLTISKDIPETGMDYTALRSEAITLLQSLAPNTWTDHNVTDPGMTLLEALCYCITDLSYRLGFDIQDILAADPNISDSSKQFFSAREILPCNPVTTTDYRKLLIDIDGVRNAWLEIVDDSTYEGTKIVYDSSNASLSFPYSTSSSDTVITPNGLYRILLDTDDNAGDIDELVDTVQARLNSYRNLAEDFQSVQVLTDEQIQIKAEIEITRDADVNAVMAQVYFDLETYLSPRINFYSLDEALATGKDVDALFTGPALDHGFLDSDEIEQYQRTTELHTADIISSLVEIDGVDTVKDVKLSKGDGTDHEWILDLDDINNNRFVLKSLSDIITDGDITFSSHDGVYTPSPILLTVSDNLYILRDEADETVAGTASQYDISVEDGNYRNLTDYVSVQNELPRVYGVGENSLPSTASKDRQAQAKQLQAYLMLFDQLLQNELAQLANTRELLAIESQRGVVDIDYDNPEASNTYYTETLSTEVAGYSDIIKDYASSADEGYANALSEMVMDTDTDTDRMNRFADHLLARHGVEFTADTSLYPDTDTGTTVWDKADASLQVIPAKQRFLQDYIDISRDRGRSYDPTGEAWDTENVSGLQKRIARLLDIQDYSRRTLAYQSDHLDPLAEGFHLVDHIELRPDLPTGHIDSFTSDTASDDMLCENTTVEHGLETGDEIMFVDTSYENYKGSAYTITKVDEYKFTIDANYQDPGGTLSNESGTWISSLQTQAQAISFLSDTFAIGESSDNNTTIHVDGLHDLAEGDQIIIIHSNETSLNGLHTVSNVDDLNFDIDLSYNSAFANEAGVAQWHHYPIYGDPYSCQLTFVFPSDVGRMSESGGGDNFRKVIAEVIKTETPAHIRPWLCFLDDGDLQGFETAYQDWLTARAATQTNHQKIDTANKAITLFTWLCQYSNSAGVLLHEYTNNMTVGSASSLTFTAGNLIEIHGHADTERVTTNVKINSFEPSSFVNISDESDAPDRGYLDVNSSTSSNASYVWNEGDYDMTISGELSDVNILLQDLSYFPDAYVGDDIILTITTTVDVGGSTATDEISITSEATS